MSGIGYAVMDTFCARCACLICQAASVETRSLVSELITAKTLANRRPAYVTSLKHYLNRFALRHPRLDTVSHVDIEQWLMQFPSLYSRQTWLNRINTFFVFAKRRGYVQSNPCERIEPITIDAKPPGIHTVEQAETLLRKCQSDYPDLIGYIAPIYFGGLRPIESEKLLQIHLFQDLIEVTPENCKTRRRRFIMIPDALKAWLAVPGIKFGGQFSRSTLRRRLRALKRSLAPFPWPHDVARHSFCSYGLPIFGSAKISEWAGHSEKALYRHYRERVKPADAERYWALRP